MKKIFTVVFSVFVLTAFSKGFMSYDSTRFSVAGGFSFATSNLKRDLTNTLHPAVDAKVQMFLARGVRLSAEYTYGFKHDLGVRWLDVESNLFELNVHCIAAINDYKSGFYTITGLALQSWKGFYTGIAHEYEFRQYGNPQSYYSSKWPSLTTGLGLQRTFKKLEVYGEFKYRLIKKEENIPASIIDMAYSIGVRYNLKAKSEGKRKSIIKMPGDRYHWF